MNKVLVAYFSASGQKIRHGKEAISSKIPSLRGSNAEGAISFKIPN